MLLSFRVENHRSLRDEQELLLTSAEQGREGFPPPSEISPLRVTGIFGANASGKTSVVKALRFMADMVIQGPISRMQKQRSLFSLEDDEDRIPREPFQLDADSQAKNSGYSVELLLDGYRYTYGFTVNDTEILEEWLYLYTDDGTERVAFEREGLSFTYGSADPNSPELTDVLSVEPNSLLISVLANAHPTTFHSETVAALGNVRRWFRSSLQIWQGEMGRAGMQRLPSNSPELLERLVRLARAADTGISDYSDDGPISDEERAEIEEQVGKNRARSMILARERGRVSFRHQGSSGEYPLDFLDESSGTRSILSLGILIMRVLERGGTLVVDEIDTSLHSVLSGSLVSLFKDRESNPLASQLVFTSHDTSLMGRVNGREVLSEDEIWLTEKSTDGSTSLYPMSSFESSGEENRDRRYLVGRYGAVPFVDEDLLVQALRPRLSERKKRGSGEGLFR
ncbi:ATP-binding protein [Nocardiopsis dassonvillei]|uniref:AAA family ATPase n=1 Tax=Nocardiopsis dassonvillei TaxID=2014 RepID=UPI0033FAA9B2